MTQDEIREMAREAGFDCYREEITWDDVNCTEELVAFAKLIEQSAADKEREACAKKAEAQNCHMVAAAIRARGGKHD